METANSQVEPFKLINVDILGNRLDLLLRSNLDVLILLCAALPNLVKEGIRDGEAAVDDPGVHDEDGPLDQFGVRTIGEYKLKDLLLDNEVCVDLLGQVPRELHPLEGHLVAIVACCVTALLKDQLESCHSLDPLLEEWARQLCLGYFKIVSLFNHIDVGRRVAELFKDSHRLDDVLESRAGHLLDL